MIDETFLTTEEVLEYLQVNLRTVYRLIKRHGLSTYRQVGDRRTWIDRDEIRPLIGLRRKQTSSDGAGGSVAPRARAKRRARATGA